jgi:protein-S-isoprenylcysteine O-methyltransferase Ste14
MTDHDLLRQLRSFVLPFTVAVIIPFLVVGRFRPFGVRLYLPLPFVQIPLSVLLFSGGFLLLVITIRLFIKKGNGTLAPWDPTRRLVTEGVYRRVRNPMISGVLFLLIGEAVLLGSWLLLVWALVFAFVNTLYFRLSEEPGLAKRFGEEYLLYKHNVPMWIPKRKHRTKERHLPL